jgi:hypothetical protein
MIEPMFMDLGVYRGISNLSVSPLSPQGSGSVNVFPGQGIREAIGDMLDPPSAMPSVPYLRKVGGSSQNFLLCISKEGRSETRFCDINKLDLQTLRSRNKKTYKLNSMVRVRERTIPTERPPLVGEVIANLCE